MPKSLAILLAGNLASSGLPVNDMVATIVVGF